LSTGLPTGVSQGIQSKEPNTIFLRATDPDQAPARETADPVATGRWQWGRSLALMIGPPKRVAEKWHRAPSAHTVKSCSLCLELPGGPAEIPNKQVEAVGRQKSGKSKDY
jgi:hypothetical protein